MQHIPAKTATGIMLAGQRIAVPESRQLDVLATLVENRGGEVMRVPLVSIHDAPDPQPVISWILSFIELPPDLFIILTGEGLRRLLGFAEREGVRESFVSALSRTALMTRGPKPQRALSEIGLATTHPAANPTTQGIIETLETLNLDGLKVAVQLYGEDPNILLQDYLSGRKVEISCVAPYIYADKIEEGQVVAFIHALAAGEIDIITFTSQPQLKRLLQVAGKCGLLDELKLGLNNTVIAAVGPVVRDQLEGAGFVVSIMPEKQFFMKPLVTAMVRFVEQNPTRDN